MFFLSFANDYHFLSRQDYFCSRSLPHPDFSRVQKDLPTSTMSLSSPVCRIFWDKPAYNQVLVVTQDGTSYLTDHVILTPSIGHLKERHASLFSPALPADYQNAMAVRPSGHDTRRGRSGVMNSFLRAHVLTYVLTYFHTYIQMHLHTLKTATLT